MRRVLALDTSTWWGGVALIEQATGEAPTVIAEAGFQVHGSHAEPLMGRVMWLLAEAGWSKNALDGYAAARGPGSFTGIRIGLGTVRGLSLGSGRPCYGVSTLEALALAHGPAALPRVPLIHAGRGELFTAVYDARSTPPFEVDGPRVAAFADLLEEPGARDRLLVPAPGTRLEHPGLAGFLVAAAPRGVAGAVGRIVASRSSALSLPAPPLAPLYVRPADVRIQRREAADRRKTRTDGGEAPR